MCTMDEAVVIMQEAYHETNQIMPIQDAWLYGSYARGDYRPDSDVDILLLTPLSQSEINRKQWDIAGVASDLSLDHDVTVSVIVRPIDAFQPEMSLYFANVAKDGIKILA